METIKTRRARWEFYKPKETIDANPDYYAQQNFQIKEIEKERHAMVKTRFEQYESTNSVRQKAPEGKIQPKKSTTPKNIQGINNIKPENQMKGVKAHTATTKLQESANTTHQ